MIAKRLLRPLLLILLLAIALIGAAVGVGYGLPMSSQMIYTKTFDSVDIRTVSIFLRDTSRNIDQRLTREQGVNALADWSPDGQQIVYLSFNSDNVFHVYLMDAQGSHKRRLALEFDNVDSTPSWSPDGQWILISGSTQGVYKTVLFNLVSEKSFAIPKYIAGRMRWSPDSQSIFYLANGEDGLDHLFGLNISCLSAVESCQFAELNLLPNESVYSGPTWSPDGKFFAFSKYENDKAQVAIGHMRCSELKASCIDSVQVIADTSMLDFSPIWSPDDKQLAFVEDHYQFNFYQIETGATRSITITGIYPFLKDWSPDGRFVAFLSEQDGIGNTYLLDVMSGETRPLLTDQVTSEFPKWRPMPR